MRRSALILNCVLICLPAVVLCGVTWLLLAERIPKTVAADKSRAARVYRKSAEALVKGEAEATFAGERDKAWRASGRIAKGDGTSVQWGYAPLRPGVEFVWAGPASGPVAGLETEAQEVYDPSFVVYLSSGLLLGLFALTAFCLRFFLRYARERDDLLAAAAHDLSTPLAGMRHLIGFDDADAMNMNERMIRIVDNIQSFMRRGGGREWPEPSAFALVDAFNEAYRLFAADFEDSPSGPVGISGDTGAEAFANRAAVVQILWNLLGNELKYAASHGAVRARIFRDGAEVALEIEDEGPGMTRRQMAKAFKRYYRAKAALDSGRGGFGIGLCTARESARLMGGDISVRANSPTGCVFTLRLPQRLRDRCRV